MAQPFFKGHLRLELENLPRARDVGLRVANVALARRAEHRRDPLVENALQRVDQFEQRHSPAGGEVHDLLAAGGLVIERITYWNCALLPLVAASRAASRLRGRSATAARSDVTVPPAPVNAALGTIARLEGQLLNRVDLPTGSSLLAVARKP